MAGERADDLAQLCTELVRKGNDFPTVWNIDGPPLSKIEGTQPVLEMRLRSPA